MILIIMFHELFPYSDLSRKLLNWNITDVLVLTVTYWRALYYCLVYDWFPFCWSLLSLSLICDWVWRMFISWSNFCRPVKSIPAGIAIEQHISHEQPQWKPGDPTSTHKRRWFFCCWFRSPSSSLPSVPPHHWRWLRRINWRRWRLFHTIW